MDNIEVLLHNIRRANERSDYVEKKSLLEIAKSHVSSFLSVDEYDSPTLNIIGMVFVQIGNIEKEEANFDEAMMRYENARRCFTATNNYEGLAKVKACIADVYSSRHDYQMALSLLFEAKIEFEHLQLEKETATTLDQLFIRLLS